MMINVNNQDMIIITISKLKEYEQYQGEEFHLYSGNRITNSEEWELIDQLIQDLKLVRRGLASYQYANRLNNELVKHCDNNATIEEIKRISDIL